MTDIADEWARKDLNEVTATALDMTQQAHVRAGIEMQRRTIVSLERASEQSEQASQRLLVATWVLIALTVVLVVLTVAIIVSD